MNAWIEALNGTSATWFDAILRASWHGAVILAVVWLISHFLSRIPPIYKVWLWRLAFLKLLVTLLWLTPVTLSVLPRQDPGIAIQESISTVVHVSAVETLPAVAVAEKSVPDWRALLFALWALGTFCCAIRLARHWREARRLIRHSQPLQNPAIEAIAAVLAQRFNVRRAPSIGESSLVSSPVLVGAFRPHVILPHGLEKATSLSQWELMLAHEFAHLRRKDLLWMWLFTFGEALFFFHPLVWLARKEWTLATETACDELAMRVTRQTPRDYGEMLVQVVAQSALRNRAALLAVGMAENANTLKRRLKLMITTRTPLGKITGIALIVLAIITLAPWKLVAETPDAEALMKLKDENARLRQELEATRAEMEKWRKGVLPERELEMLDARRGPLIDLQRKAEALANAKREFAELQAQFADEHPNIRVKRAQLQALEADLTEAAKREQLSRSKTNSAVAEPRGNKQYQERQRELLRKEIELAERHAEFVRKALENGKEVPASQLAAQREVLDLKLQRAKLSADKAEQRAVLWEQLAIAERALKEYRIRVEVGTLQAGAEIPFEREVLRIKRELYMLEFPNVRN